MLKRSILIVSSVILVTAAALTFFRKDGRKPSEKALEHLSQNAFLEAEAVLNSTFTGKDFPISLYRGYLAQCKGRYKEADHLFQNASKQKLKDPKEKEALVQEIGCAQMISAYFEQGDFSTHLASHPTSDPLFPFFEGLHFYLQGQYAEALNAWRFFSLPSLKEGSGWRSFIFEYHFPQRLRNIYLAHSMIETGELLKGREILEKEGHLSLQENDSPILCNLFLGLSYLKEAQKIPLEQRVSYYKLACFYFDRSSPQSSLVKPTFSRDFTQEKALVAGHIQKEIKNLLFTHGTTESKKWAFDLIKNLVSWEADSDIDQIAESISKKLFRPKNASLCLSIKKEFLGTSFHSSLSERVMTAISSDFKKGEIRDLSETFNLIEPLFDSPQECIKKIASLSSEEIFDAIKRDDPMLSRFQNYITFWEKAERSLEEKTHLASELFFTAKLFWQKEGQEKKGLRLMDLACKLSPRVRDEVELFLTTIYNDAESCNMICRLSFIYDALEHFQMSRKELISPVKLANHLADAEYLYQTRNFLAAQTHATWVLKIDGSNESALRLVGLSSFQLGEYGKAAYALQMLSNPDEMTKRALLLSEAFQSQQEKKHLAQIDTLNSLKED